MVGGTALGQGLGCYDPSESGGTCPIGCPECVCASPDTAVATPLGERAIATLAIGDLVYTIDQGVIVAAPIVLTHRQPAPHHHVVRVRFSDGSSIAISAPHPTADGRRFGQLRAGDELGSKRISDVRIVPYEFERTYDILPASDTGTYFAGGALIGSTLGGSANEAAVRADASDGNPRRAARRVDGTERRPSHVGARTYQRIRPRSSGSVNHISSILIS